MEWKQLSWSLIVALGVAVSTAATALDSSQASTLANDHAAIANARAQFITDRANIRATNIANGTAVGPFCRFCWRHRWRRFGVWGGGFAARVGVRVGPFGGVGVRVGFRRF